MNYEKPNIALVASAVEAVKSHGKDPNDQLDTFQTTSGAYESDE
jgi:hypothetical protein